MRVKEWFTEYKGCQFHVKRRSLIPILFHGNVAAFDFTIKTDTRQSDLAIPIRARFPDGRISENLIKIEVPELLPNKPLREKASFFLDCIGVYRLEIPEGGNRSLTIHSFIVHSRSALFLTVIGAFIGALAAGFIINLLFN